MPDGGGYFCTIDGHIRKDGNNDYDFDDGWLSACESVELLNKWFSERNIDTSSCAIKEYDIPDNEIRYTQTHVIFPKKYYYMKKGN